MSSRAKREKYRYDGPAARSTAATNAATRPSWARSRYGIGTISVPISAGASRAVKFESPNTVYIAAVK
jgi:hypothetical protein